MKSTFFFPSSILVTVLLSFLIATPSGMAQSFTLSATPGTVTIHPRDQNVPVSVSVSNSSYTGPINVTLIGLPSGITASSLVLNGSGSGTINLNASVSADQEAFPATSPINPNSVSNAVTVVGVAGTTVISSPMTLVVSLSNPAFTPDPSKINLPIVTINTSGTPVTSKTVNVPGTVSITSADGQTVYLAAGSTATFHVHGNSTAEMPKLAYEMKLSTSTDLFSTMGLTCPYVTGAGKPICDKSKTYLLLANYDDKTFLRDWAASALANAIPIGNGYLDSPADSPTPSGTSKLMPWAPHSLFVELYLNGVYEGNYQLIEKVNVDSHRINISELSQTDTTDDITGGYLLEIDARHDEDYDFITPRILAIGLVDPDFTPEVSQQTSYISNYVDTAEYALFSVPFKDPTIGWRAYFDEASAVNFYIINDVMGNVDGGSLYSSDYFYKAKDNPLLYMGPIWDFDISSGNVNYQPITNPTAPWMQTQALWYRQWFRDPGFTADVATQWNALKNNGVLTSWLTSIQQEAATLEQSQKNNFGRWPMQGVEVWPNAEAAGSYDGEVSYLTSWLNLRIAYLDSVFNNRPQTTTILNTPGGILQQGTAATLSASVTGGSSPTGNISFFSGAVLLGTSAIDGSGNATLTTSNLPAGNDSLEAVYSGDGNNGLSASNLVPVTVLPPLVNTFTTLTTSTSTLTPQNSAVTLTAVVLANSGSTAPAGIVNFTANGQAIGSAALNSNGVAALSPTALPSGNNSIQAIYAGNTTDGSSSSNTVNFSVTPVAIPVFSLNPGTYTTAQTVEITDATPGAVIYYTTDGTIPTAASTTYNGAISILANKTLNAIAVVPNYAPSGIATAIYTIPPNYTLASNTNSLSLVQGQTGNAILTLNSVGDFHGSVQFGCMNLPIDVTCTFTQNPVQLTGNNQPVTVTLTIATSIQSAKLSKPESGKPLNPLFPALIFWIPGATAGLASFRSKKKLKRRWIHLCFLGILTGSLVGLNACGSAGPQYAGSGTSTVLVTATSALGTLAPNQTAGITLKIAAR